jgi:hypothetical protein
VTTILEISLRRYDGFVDQCDPASREYAILKNGVIVRRSQQDYCEGTVEIQCTVAEAKALLDLAKQIYPSAASEIETGLAVAL